jgi:SNF family Na+-dependent transporter
MGCRVGIVFIVIHQMCKAIKTITYYKTLLWFSLFMSAGVSSCYCELELM